MTDTRQFIVRFDRRHDAAAIARIEQQPSMSEYIRELVRRDTSDENAKLRKELAKARDPQRIGGQADPSSFVYAIEQLREFRWQHATNDEDAIPYINNVAAAHERENAKLREQLADVTESMGRVEERCAALRELVRHLYVCRSYTAINGGDDMPCEECEYDNDKWLCDFEERMREMGVESKE